MSPRRKITPTEHAAAATVANRPGGWRSRSAEVLGALLVVLVVFSGMGAATVVAMNHRTVEHRAENDQRALSYVRWFLVEFTTLDPFHANDYVLRIQAQASGDFAKKFTEHQNEIALQVARAERTTGSILDAGVERWNDDGSVTVLVVTLVTSKSPDEKQVYENANRWTATAKQEGNQWKISALEQVI